MPAKLTSSRGWPALSEQAARWGHLSAQGPRGKFTVWPCDPGLSPPFHFAEIKELVLLDHHARWPAGPCQLSLLLPALRLVLLCPSSLSPANPLSPAFAVCSCLVERWLRLATWSVPPAQLPAPSGLLRQGLPHHHHLSTLSPARCLNPSSICDSPHRDPGSSRSLPSFQLPSPTLARPSPSLPRKRATYRVW